VPFSPLRTGLGLTALAVLAITAAVRTPGRQGGLTTRSVEPDATHANGDGGLPRPGPRRRGEGGGWRRRLGKVLIALGVLLAGYAAAIVFWRDPATDLYARWKQHQLAGQLDRDFAAYASTVKILPPVEEQATPPTKQEIVAYERERVEAAANKMNRHLKMGKPIARLIVPRIGVRAVVVQGTRWGPDLSQGPGHYPQSSLAGVGRTMAIAGHRTTFGAWFRHIDSLKAGDPVTVRLPYGTFHYRVFGHRIVDNGDWRIIHDRGFDTLVLSACHPLYSASHRWIVFAALVRVDPVKGIPYLVNRHNEVRPLRS
jgi:sortase A